MSEEEFDVEMTKLSGELKKQFDKSDQLQNKILNMLRGIGYGD
jgi:type I restriction enzyme M protein